MARYDHNKEEWNTTYTVVGVKIFGYLVDDAAVMRQDYYDVMHKPTELQSCVRHDGNTGFSWRLCLYRAFEHQLAMEQQQQQAAAAAAAAAAGSTIPKSDDFLGALTMVRIWYTPPPFGPGTDLHTTPYGCKEGVSPQWLVRLSKMPKPIGVGIPVMISCIICYLPFINQKLPFTFDPEYLAARRAYMRYHNMNPISGISSKQSRATDP